LVINNKSAQLSIHVDEISLLDAFDDSR